MALQNIDVKMRDTPLPSGALWLTAWITRAQFDLFPGTEVHQPAEGPEDKGSWHKSYHNDLIELDSATWEPPIPPNARNG